MSIYISWHPHQQLLSESTLKWVWTGFSFYEKQWESTNEAEHLFLMLIVVQLPSCAWICVTTCSATCKSSLFFTIPQNLLKLISIELVMPPNHLILSHPLSPFSFNLSQHQDLFQLVNSSHQVVKALEFLLQHQSFQWIARADFFFFFFFFRIDWFDLLVVQETLKSLLQYHSSKPSVLWLSAFFMATLTSIHDHWKKTNKQTNKNIDLTIQIFVSKVMFLLFIMPSRFVITFSSRIKYLLYCGCSQCP